MMRWKWIAVHWMRIHNYFITPTKAVKLNKEKFLLLYCDFVYNSNTLGRERLFFNGVATKIISHLALLKGNPMSQKKIPPSDKPAAPSTRERILAHLKENRTTSAVELAYAWGLTRADLRYHLSQLHKDGLIEPTPRDPNADSGRGRPVIRYRLCEEASAHSLVGLCRALLGVLVQPMPDEKRTEIIQALAVYLAGPPLPSVPLARRLTQALQMLNRHPYHARWEAHAHGPRILFRNCPYAPLLAEYPDLCRMDGYLLEKLVAVPIRQVSRMNLETGQPPACIFAVRPT